MGPLGELLTCDRVSLAKRGAGVIKHLNNRKQLGSVWSELDWLAFHAFRDKLNGIPVQDHNRVAAIEILTRHESPEAADLVLRYLSLPLREYHLYVVPLARQEGILPSDREFVRENRRNSQDRVDAFPVNGALGWRLRLPD